MRVLDKTLDDPRPARRKPESLAKIKKAARKLFVERGYHATRPQDIAREAGLGHGTFYLHYPDKRACFLAFVEDARTELDGSVRARMGAEQTLEELIASTLQAIYDYSQSHPGVLNAAMTDEAVIDAEGVQAIPLLQRWGNDWATIVRSSNQQRALLDRPEARAVLPLIKCPALVLCGRQDVWSPVSQHEEIAAAIPHSKLVIVEDSGHMSPVEQPEAVTDALLAWLSHHLQD